VPTWHSCTRRPLRPVTWGHSTLDPCSAVRTVRYPLRSGFSDEGR
jgi:hypothetical protein